MAQGPEFDRTLTRVSLLIDTISYLLIFFLTNQSSSTLFIFFSCLTSLTAGGNPAMHSLAAVVLHHQGRSDETGKLFGALAVLSAVAHIVSPGLYAFVYGATVAHHPRIIYVLAAALLIFAIAAFSAVKVGYDQTEVLQDGEDV